MIFVCVVVSKEINRRHYFLKGSLCKALSKVLLAATSVRESSEVIPVESLSAVFLCVK